MNQLLVILLCLTQAESLPEEWECSGKSNLVPHKQVGRLKPSQMNERIVRCKTPRLPGNVDAKGTVLIEIVVSEAGDVECLRAMYGHPIIRGAAVEAAKQWKFRPLVVDRTAKPYSGIIAVYVSWDAEEMEKHCPTHRKPKPE